jgi:hypothetical protein
LSEKGVDAGLKSISDMPSRKNLGVHVAVGEGVEEEEGVEDLEVIDDRAELVELAGLVVCGL